MMKTSNVKSEKWINDNWTSYSTQIYNLCRKKCSDKDEAKDLFQNVALKFCQNASKIMSKDSVFPWLICVLNSCFYDRKRRLYKEAPFTAVSDVLGDYRAIPTEKSVFYRNTQIDEVKRVVKSLNDNDRELIKMIFKDGLSTKQISTMYGISINSVLKRRQSTIRRARKILLD